MSSIAFNQVSVVGAGQMGHGIAQVCAQAGSQVILLDIEGSALKKAEAAISKSLNKLAEKGKITTSQKECALKNLTYTSEWSSLAPCDLVIEAVSEREDLKNKVFHTLAEIVKPEAIFASNTSSISITRLGAASKRPDRFIGMHFMNPVPLMELVEIITGLGTHPQTKDAIISYCNTLGKTISHSQDYPGFVVNRILMPMINEAFQALMEGVASAEDIDRGMKLGTNQPMGPLTLADFIGLDTCLAIMEVLHRGLGDDKYRASPLLKKYVEAGYLGRKTGRGVYLYEA